MSGATVAPGSAPRRVNWLKAALIASLAVNLLVAGAVAARWYMGPPPERYARLTQAQLIPRLFLRDLDRARRVQLTAVLKAQDKDIRDGRQAVKAQVMALADALEAEPYDPALVKSAVDGFTAKSLSLFQTGSAAALAVIGQLTPGERRLMAQHLRNREDRGRGKPGAGKPDQP
ncbi:periplasmic heavy metal sensor [Aestuariivirga sp.]|uniref:periplasmic heavy metal sensor n=1 Tax=Aestuariivirga sp. TaxID=2650926 RepID=UPI0025BEBCBC|nr:periplasmic heavy metal sensor [Aestuariivirga sp.]MCA3554488.1 periplasmic heavy metal sensor [Aestuariivirga sp.]